MRKITIDLHNGDKVHAEWGGDPPWDTWGEDEYGLWIETWQTNTNKKMRTYFPWTSINFTVEVFD